MTLKINNIGNLAIQIHGADYNQYLQPKYMALTINTALKLAAQIHGTDNK